MAHFHGVVLAQLCLRQLDCRRPGGSQRTPLLRLGDRPVSLVRVEKRSRSTFQAGAIRPATRRTTGDPPRRPPRRFLRRPCRMCWCRAVKVGTDRIAREVLDEAARKYFLSSKKSERPELINDRRLAAPTTRHGACSTRIRRLTGPSSLGQRQARAWAGDGGTTGASTHLLRGTRSAHAGIHAAPGDASLEQARNREKPGRQTGSAPSVTHRDCTAFMF